MRAAHLVLAVILLTLLLRVAATQGGATEVSPPVPKANTSGNDYHAALGSASSKNPCPFASSPIRLNSLFTWDNSTGDRCECDLIADGTFSVVVVQGPSYGSPLRSYDFGGALQVLSSYFNLVKERVNGDSANPSTATLLTPFSLVAEAMALFSRTITHVISSDIFLQSTETFFSYNGLWRLLHRTVITISYVDAAYHPSGAWGGKVHLFRGPTVNNHHQFLNGTGLEDCQGFHSGTTVRCIDPDGSAWDWGSPMCSSNSDTYVPQSWKRWWNGERLLVEYLHNSATLIHRTCIFEIPTFQSATFGVLAPMNGRHRRNESTKLEVKVHSRFDWMTVYLISILLGVRLLKPYLEENCVIQVLFAAVFGIVAACLALLYFVFGDISKTRMGKILTYSFPGMLSLTTFFCEPLLSATHHFITTELQANLYLQMTVLGVGFSSSFVSFYFFRDAVRGGVRNSFVGLSFVGRLAFLVHHLELVVFLLGGYFLCRVFRQGMGIFWGYFFHVEKTNLGEYAPSPSPLPRHSRMSQQLAERIDAAAQAPNFRHPGVFPLGSLDEGVKRK